RGPFVLVLPRLRGEFICLPVPRQTPDELLPRAHPRADLLSRSLRLAVPAAARRVDLEDIARLHLGRADVPELLLVAVRAHDAIDADESRLAAGEPERAVLAAVRQDARRHRFEEAH